MIIIKSLSLPIVFILDIIKFIVVFVGHLLVRILFVAIVSGIIAIFFPPAGIIIGICAILGNFSTTWEDVMDDNYFMYVALKESIKRDKINKIYKKHKDEFYGFKSMMDILEE